MTWCFSTRTSVATVLMTHPCISSSSWSKDFSVLPIELYVWIRHVIRWTLLALLSWYPLTRISSNESQWLGSKIGHQDSSPDNGQSVTYSPVLFIVLFMEHKEIHNLLALLHYIYTKINKSAHYSYHAKQVDGGYPWKLSCQTKENFCGVEPIYYHGLPFIPAWISNHLPSKVLAEIIYPFLNLNSCTV